MNEKFLIKLVSLIENCKNLKNISFDLEHSALSLN